MNAKTTLSKWFLLPIVIVANLSSLNVAIAEKFDDVDTGDTHYIAISYLEENNLVDGYEDNTFRSGDDINRAETLKFVLLASGLTTEEELNEEYSDLDKIEQPFADTPISEWYIRYVLFAKEKGLIDGYEDDTFRPNKTVNLAEFLKIYLNCYENIIYPSIEGNIYDDIDNNSWYTKYFALAKLRELLDIPLSNNARPEQEMTRGYSAEIIYRMIKSAEEYHFGKATFYGAAVQGSGTASGETFDKDKLTAAHRTLPFGTIVEVINLANGESVNVKINDRGPYGAGRVIDLSSGAFKEIASLGAGVVNVQYKVISTP